MERESFTEWGAPGGRRPVVAGIVRHPRGNGCFHLVYVPDLGIGDPHEMIAWTGTSLANGERYREVRAAVKVSPEEFARDADTGWATP